MDQPPRFSLPTAVPLRVLSCLLCFSTLLLTISSLQHRTWEAFFFFSSLGTHIISCYVFVYMVKEAYSRGVPPLILAFISYRLLNFRLLHLQLHPRVHDCVAEEMRPQVPSHTSLAQLRVMFSGFSSDFKELLFYVNFVMASTSINSGHSGNKRKVGLVVLRRFFKNMWISLQTMLLSALIYQLEV